MSNTCLPIVYAIGRCFKKLVIVATLAVLLLALMAVADRLDAYVGEYVPSDARLD